MKAHKGSQGRVTGFLFLYLLINIALSRICVDLFTIVLLNIVFKINQTTTRRGGVVS